MSAGMPGMGMDPMAMSNGMYSGFGGQGVGMNGMNMGMGFDAGQGAFGGFNGQPAAWNAGQNKFNQNAYGGHAGMGGSGDFGANAGYGGYNMPPHQGNYNQMHHHQYPNNDFHHGHHGQGFHNRGRGRGRGYQYAGRGRGGYNQVSQGNNLTNNEPFYQQISPQITRRGSPQYGEKQEQPAQSQQDQADTEGQQDTTPDDAAAALTAAAQLNKELAPGDADDDAENSTTVPAKEEEAPVPNGPAVPDTTALDQPNPEVEPAKDGQKSAPINSFISDDRSKSDVAVAENKTTVPTSMMPPPSPIIPTGPAADQSMDTSPRGRGAGRGFHGGAHYRAVSQGRGSGCIPNNNFHHVQHPPAVVKPLVPPVVQGLGVEGAPKAPKALREGQPNTGVKGFSIAGRASAAAQSRPNGHTATKRYVQQLVLSSKL